MIRLSHLQKFYGERTLFQDVNLTIGEKEKIGLIGRNGTGKSTLLRILLGEDSPQEGEVEIPPYFRIRALEQHLNFSEKTILEQVIKALPDEHREDAWKAKSILMGLGFNEADFNREPYEFSSGFQVRVRLAEALVSECDMLLLDEPTNYLDIVSLRWLERFLGAWKNGFILVTHDRTFMNKVVTHTVAIHRGKMRKMRGGPQKLMDQIEKEEEVYEKTRQNQIKKKERTEEFIRNFRSGARSAGLVQSRIKALAKQDIGVRLENIPKIRFHFRSLPFRADTLLQADKLSFGYQADKPLIKDLDLNVQYGDRIAIIGRNGKGKSTLLKLLTQQLKPVSGKVNMHPALEVGYFGADNKNLLTNEKSILEELNVSPDITEQRVRDVCGALLFSGEEVKKKISVLSGGEKSRVCLGKVILKPHHLLALDEPTNHLDMESCQALSQALKKFEGTVIFVTHDEAILSEVATRLILFDGGTVRVIEKTYDEFLATEGWSEEDARDFRLSRTDSETKQSYLEQKEEKKRQRQQKTELEKLEKELVKLEKEKMTVSKQLGDACLDRNTDQIRRLGIRLKEIEEGIQGWYKRLEELI